MFGKLLLVIGLVLWTSPAWAGVPNAAALTKLSDEKLGSLIVKLDSQKANECDAAVLFGELARRKPENPILAVSEYFAGLCIVNDPKRSVEALAHFERAEGLFPADGDLAIRHGIDFMATIVAGYSQNATSFAEHAGHLAVRDRPEEFADLNDETWPQLLQLVGREGAEPAALALARASSFTNLPDKTRRAVAYWALRPAVKAGETELALRLATDEPNPRTFVRLLIDRDYAVLWPRLEAAAGPQLSKVREGYVATYETAHRKDPKRTDTVTLLAQARLWNGDARGALAEGAGIDTSPAGLARIVEDQAWTLDTLVAAHDALDEPAQADRLAQGLAALPPEGRDWLVNFAINHADRLVGQARWAEALPAAERAVSIAATQGSPYAKQVAAVDRYCAAIALDPGRAELGGWWQTIDAGWRDNIGAAVQAAFCKQDLAAAGRFVRAGLKDDKTRTETIALLQQRELAFYRDTRNMRTDPRSLLAGDPELTALYRQYGRDLPAALLPQTPGA